MGKVVSLEGAPCSGKSTLRASLEASFSEQEGHLFLPTIKKQQSFRATAPKYPGSYSEARKNEDWFLEQEREKMEQAREHSYGLGNAIVERDYLSALGFSYAFSLHSGIDTFPEFVSKYEHSRPIQPDLRILLRISPEEILRRNQSRGKKLDNLFSNFDFLTSLTQYFNSYDSPTTLVYDSLMNPNEIAQSVTRKIEELQNE